MSKKEKDNKRERIEFLDCYALKHATVESTAVLKKRRKKVSIKLPDGVTEALQMVKNQGFSLVEIK